MARSEKAYSGPISDTLRLSLSELMPIISEVLDSGMSVEIAPHGVSMLPMLRDGRDTVILSRPEGKLKKYDVPLYRREDGSFVLHRVVKVGESYTCIGDNQFVYEEGVTDDQIIAVMTSFRRGKRVVSKKSVFYRLYCILWNATRGLRHFVKRAKRKLRRMIKRKK